MKPFDPAESRKRRLSQPKVTLKQMRKQVEDSLKTKEKMGLPCRWFVERRIACPCGCYPAPGFGTKYKDVEEYFKAKNICQLCLCESQHLFLRPNQLYFFTVDKDCAKCVELAKHYE